MQCGQCAAVCPVGAITERNQIDVVWDALEDPTKTVVVQTAPAIRAALGECFDYAPGTLVTGKMVAALRRMGFDAVFDTNFTADLTIMEEGTELLVRLKKALVDGEQVALPQFSSCSPGWINYMEHFNPDMLANLSTCKSPQQMFGALAKTYYAEKIGVKPEDMVVVSVMPCTAKKYEAQRPEMNDSGVQDVDVVLTTRELGAMITQAGIDFRALPDEKMDAPLGISTGAADIFAVTGGVMEAALRTAWEIVTQTPFPFPNLHVEPIEGLEGVKVATVKVDGRQGRLGLPRGRRPQGRRGARPRQRPEGHRPGQDRRSRVPLRRGHDLPRRLHRRRRPAALHHQRGAPARASPPSTGRTSTASCASRTRTPSCASSTRSTSGRPAARSRTTSCTPTTSSTSASEHAPVRRGAGRVAPRPHADGDGREAKGPPAILAEAGRRTADRQRTVSTVSAEQRLILIVDDDFDFLEINRIILEGAGYRVVTATNPDEARARIADEVPDLIITDLMMDSLDAGFAFSACLKDDPRTAEVPIIISTSVTSALGLDFRPRSAEDMQKMRVDAYFDKPIDGRALLAKVAELLGADR